MLLEAGAHVEVLARSGIRRVYTDSLAEADVHATSASHRLQRWRDAWRLRSRHYDAALVMSPSFSAALAAVATGASARVGERRDGRSLLLTQRLAPSSRDVHLARSYEKLAVATLSALHGSPGAAHGSSRMLRQPRLQARAPERKAAAELLRQHGIEPQDKLLVVAPGARYGAAKRYPAERFAAAANALHRELQSTVVLVGSEGDRAETAACRANLPEAIDLTGQTSLAVLLGVLASAQGVLSNDSGVMHLTAALGTPVVAVFGSTHPGWTAPLGPAAQVVQNAVPCAPCFRKRCPIDFPCMLGLEPRRLVDAMLALLQPDGPSRPETATPL